VTWGLRRDRAVPCSRRVASVLEVTPNERADRVLNWGKARLPGMVLERRVLLCSPRCQATATTRSGPGPVEGPGRAVVAGS
jgi:hypothetical protein